MEGPALRPAIDNESRDSRRLGSLGVDNLRELVEIRDEPVGAVHHRRPLLHAAVPTKTSAPPAPSTQISRAVANHRHRPVPKLRLDVFGLSLTPGLAGELFGSNDLYDPSSLNRMLLAKMFSGGTPSRARRARSSAAPETR